MAKKKKSPGQGYCHQCDTVFEVPPSVRTAPCPRCAAFITVGHNTIHVQGDDALEVERVTRAILHEHRIDKTLQRIPPSKLMDPITTITAISIALKVVDQIANQIDRFIHKKPEPAIEPPHTVLAEKKADVIEFKEQGKVVETITPEDIKKLDENSRKLIKALEDSMQSNYDLWAKIYPKRDRSADPVVNAQVDAQLTDIAKKMCADLNKIFRYLDSIGKHLSDHYAHIQFVCSELQGS